LLSQFQLLILIKLEYIALPMGRYWIVTLLQRNIPHFLTALKYSTKKGDSKKWLAT